jgi:predicted HAD superfamily phosphohydrolase YqeG
MPIYNIDYYERVNNYEVEGWSREIDANSIEEAKKPFSLKKFRELHLMM